jgi:LmbE family N-acetylglucosaminyl deacetylase
MWCFFEEKKRGEGGEKERRATQDLVDAIRECRPEVAVQVERWHGDDPTEHVAIFDFLRTLIRKVRRRYSGRELVVHVSPGTPSMQTIWVLMGETGFIEEPFSLVKSYRKRERRAGPRWYLSNLASRPFTRFTRRHVRAKSHQRSKALFGTLGIFAPTLCGGCY